MEKTSGASTNVELPIVTTPSGNDGHELRERSTSRLDRTNKLMKGASDITTNKLKAKTLTKLSKSAKRLVNVLNLRGINMEELQFCCLIAELSYVLMMYCDERDILQSHYCQRFPSFDVYSADWFNNESADIHGLYYFVDGVLYIGFAGTDSFQDVIRDLKAHKVPFDGDPDVTVHSGFYDGYRVVSEQIHKFIDINSKHHDISTIVCVGHSMGGALASMCAYDMKLKFPHRTIKGVTFGSPSPGGKKFQKAYNSKLKDTTFTVYQPIDPIPKLPGKFLSNYYHVGIRLRISDSARVKKALKVKAKKSGFDYHFPYVYRQQLLDLDEKGTKVMEGTFLDDGEHPEDSMVAIDSEAHEECEQNAPVASSDVRLTIS
eukprot:gene16283-19324_t